MSKKRFIRFEEVRNDLGLEEELFWALIKASGAVFQLPRIRLIKLEDLERYMKHFTTVGRSAQLIQRKYVRINEGAYIYNIGKHRFIEMARAAGAVYKLGDSGGSRVLIRLDIFDEYMEGFRQEPVRKESKNGV